MHISFMRRCLELAEKGRGRVSPNPLVGSVIVRDGKVIGEGWHEEFGGRHAERMAIERAGERARGATLYVNLEPCSKSGKQPPCSDAVIQAGIAEVVFGSFDPSNPSVALLREKGIRVTGPVLEAACRRLNRGFFSVLEQGRPWVTLKKAVMRDGKTGNAPGEERLRITSKEQDEWAHTHLRATHDAILVGSGTILADDPQLNVRYACKCHGERRRTMTRASSFVSAQDDTLPSPRRIVLDPHSEVPPTARVLTDEDAARTLVIREKLPIPELLKRLQEEGITSVLVEGGPGVWEAFEGSGCIDEIVTLVGS